MFVLFCPCLVFQAWAVIDISLQMQLGNPSAATSDTNNHNHYLIQRSIEALDYNDNRGQANWASWDLTSADANSAVARQDSFASDTNLPTNFYWVSDTEYSGSGYDRGHLCPSADRTDSTNHNDLTFLMSNMMPQAPDNNRIVWAHFEDDCRALADAGNEMLIICGPSGFGTNHISSSAHVLIPSNTWKIAVVVPLGSGTALSRITTITNRVIAIRIPNTNGVSSSWSNYVTSAHQIELDTGLNFFTALPQTIASAFRAKVDNLSTPPPPVIASFTPTSGPSNATVIISGTNFTGTSIVSFNGAQAAFYVDSNTQITATVPTNASSGPISITTPGGMVTSASSFALTGTSAVVLDVSFSHTGTFTQGGSGYTCTIVVTNLGTLASTGSVSVVNTLPPGLTATAITGIGWITNLSTLTCTRTNSLVPGAGYPPIIITVNVASNALAIVTNIVIVSGGGDATPDTSLDNIAITPTETIVYSGTLIGWDVSGVSNYGASPLPPTIVASNLTIVGLTRGSGVVTGSGAAASAWGGVNWTNASASLAVASNKFATFSTMANAGYKVSFTSVSRFDYRRSSTGATNGVLQYQIGSNAFVDITNLNYVVFASSGASIGPIDLTSVASLQNVGPGTNVTFRIVNYLGTSSIGSWYISDVANSTALDFAVAGNITLVTTTNPPALAPTLTQVIFTNRQFQFTVTGTTSSNYVVQATTNLNLANWISLMTNAAPFQFAETNLDGFPQRFYRALIRQ